jgi:hypothetical protein
MSRSSAEQSHEVTKSRVYLSMKQSRDSSASAIREAERVVVHVYTFYSFVREQYIYEGLFKRHVILQAPSDDEEQSSVN